ncbi:DNA helicase, putative [Plasmodium gaboni]|uniref:DNA helicase, putative n=1 Tax=Plasmodium gaboni TaxID=647221 RepID=A0ABY1UL69_9APIC|nr:DNA helicase, putative [Plasmodium gaboni]
MDVFEFVDPLRKRKINNNILDFNKYVYKEKMEVSEEEEKEPEEEKKKDDEILIMKNKKKKKKKKKLRRLLDSSSSDDNNENEEISSKKIKIRKLNSDSDDNKIKNNIDKNSNNEKKKKEKMIQEKEQNSDIEIIDSYDDENQKAEYEYNLNTLYQCLYISIQIKNKIIDYFTSDKKEKKTELIKEFVKGSFRVSNFQANYENFEKHVDTFHKLKCYQKCGVLWLYVLYKQNKNGILADEMGLGKTAQTCVFLDYMYKTGTIKNKTIIVAPTSLLKNWDNEINMWCPYLKNHKIIYYGSQSERRYLAYDIFSNKSNKNNKNFPSSYNNNNDDDGDHHNNDSHNNIHLIITSINMLMGKNDVSYFRQIKKYDYLIFDEAHFLKNKNSLIYKKLQKKIVFNNKILLTGSPIQNKTQELTNLLLFLMPHIFTETNINNAMQAFINMYEEEVQTRNKKKKTDEGTTPKLTTFVEEIMKKNDNQNNHNNNIMMMMNKYTDACHNISDHNNNISSNCNIYDIKCDEDLTDDNIKDHSERESNVIVSDTNKNIIKNYLIQTIRDDLKQHVEIKNKEIILLQLIIEPYILRRSKKHVFIDMPKKHSLIIKLPLNNTQLNLYKDEIFSKMQKTFKHLEFLETHSSKKELQKIYAILNKKEIKNGIKDNTDEKKESQSNVDQENYQNSHYNDNTNNIDNLEDNVEDDIDCDDDKEMDEETINIEKTDVENKNSNIVIHKRDDDSNDIDEDNIKDDYNSNNNSNMFEDSSSKDITHNNMKSKKNLENNKNSKEVRGKMINASIFILRRICNHPLLHKYYYTIEDIKKISKYFYYNTDQYVDLDLKTVENEFMKISDFDIHLSIKHLISQGDNKLNKYLITKEHILNSSKISHMLSLIKDIRKKKQKVLIFSQFTTFLDIIEEALLYEFIYDDSDYMDHIQTIKNSQSINKNDTICKEENNIDDDMPIKHEQNDHQLCKETKRHDDNNNNINEEEDEQKFSFKENIKKPNDIYNEDMENSERTKDTNHDYNKKKKDEDDEDVCLTSSTLSTSSVGTQNDTGHQIYVRLDGSTNTIERQKIIKRFSKDENIFVFLLSTKAGGVGLNLIAANHVILMDQDWNPHNDRQAEDRVHRLGQKNEVYIYRLCCKNTIEEAILKCNKAKLHLDQAFGGNSDLLQTALIKDALNAVEI